MKSRLTLLLLLYLPLFFSSPSYSLFSSPSYSLFSSSSSPSSSPSYSLFSSSPSPSYSSSSPSSSRPQWLLQKVPVIFPDHTEDLPPPLFLSSVHFNVSSSLGPECHLRAPPPSDAALRNLLAYQTLHADGHLTETAVEIYDASGFSYGQVTETAMGIYNTTAPLDSSSSSASASSSDSTSSDSSSSDSASSDSATTDPRSRRRRKRQIFGADGRFSIGGRSFLLRFPFSVAVKLSTGCSGTLVGERHVLTAAHCVHDGRNYVKGAQRLRVGFLRPKRSHAAPTPSRLLANLTERPARGVASGEETRFQWIRARRTYVPKGWLGGVAAAALDYDYALLELRKPHRRRHMRLGVSPPAAVLPGRRLHFSGFDGERPGRLLYRFCRAGEETANLLYQRCDARPGASGAGLYARMWNRRRRRWERKVIAVFSGHQTLQRRSETYDSNVAVRITPLKYAQICSWIHGDFSQCSEG